MDAKKILSFMVVVLLTTLSVSTMIYLRGRDYNITEGYEEYSEDSYEYTGYIFDDYNEKVNLGYKEEIHNDKSEYDSLDAMSLAALEIEYTPENMRAIRSENIIEKRAAAEVDYYGIDSDVRNIYMEKSYDNMDEPDKATLYKIVNKLTQTDAIQIKRIFDGALSEYNIKIVMEGIKNKLSEEEFSWFFRLVEKYKK